MHLFQKGLCLLRFLLESHIFLGTPGKLLYRVGHLLIKISLGNGCHGKVVSDFLQLSGRVGGGRVEGRLVLVLQLLGVLLDKGLQILVFAMKGGLKFLFPGRDILLPSVRRTLCAPPDGPPGQQHPPSTWRSSHVAA